MSQNLQQQMHKRAEEAKSCMKVQNEKAIEHNKQNVLKSHTNPEYTTCNKFVILSKRKTFEKMLENVKEFGNKGFTFYCFIFILIFLFCILHYVYDLVKINYLLFF